MPWETFLGHRILGPLQIFSHLLSQEGVAVWFLSYLQLPLNQRCLFTEGNSETNLLYIHPEVQKEHVSENYYCNGRCQVSLSVVELKWKNRRHSDRDIDQNLTTSNKPHKILILNDYSTTKHQKKLTVQIQLIQNIRIRPKTGAQT